LIIITCADSGCGGSLHNRFFSEFCEIRMLRRFCRTSLMSLVVASSTSPASRIFTRSCKADSAWSSKFRIASARSFSQASLFPAFWPKSARETTPKFASAMNHVACQQNKISSRFFLKRLQPCLISKLHAHLVRLYCNPLRIGSECRSEPGAASRPPHARQPAPPNPSAWQPRR